MAANRNPKLKVQFIDDIESTGAKEGFIKLMANNGKEEARYNNYGRFILNSTSPVLPLVDGGAMEYADYLEDVEENFHKVRRGGFGLFGFIKLKDFDHGHEVIMFFSKDNEDEQQLTFFAGKLTEEVKKLNIDPDDLDKHVFRVGKEPAKRGALGRWFIKYEGTVEELTLLHDPAKAGEARREKIVESQAPAPKNAEVENFVLTPDEKKIVEKIDELAKSGRLPETSRERVAVTLETGYGDHKTTTSRASYIAQHADKYFNHVKIKEE